MPTTRKNTPTARNARFPYRPSQPLTRTSVGSAGSYQTSTFWPATRAVAFRTGSGQSRSITRPSSSGYWIKLRRGASTSLGAGTTIAHADRPLRRSRRTRPRAVSPASAATSPANANQRPIPTAIAYPDLLPLSDLGRWAVVQRSTPGVLGHQKSTDPLQALPPAELDEAAAPRRRDRRPVRAPLRQQGQGALDRAVEAHQQGRRPLTVGGPLDEQQRQRRLARLRHDRAQVQLRPVERGGWLGHGDLLGKPRRVQVADVHQARGPDQPGDNEQQGPAQADGGYHITTVSRCDAGWPARPGRHAAGLRALPGRAPGATRPGSPRPPPPPALSNGSISGRCGGPKSLRSGVGTSISIGAGCPRMAAPAEGAVTCLESWWASTGRRPPRRRW